MNKIFTNIQCKHEIECLELIENQIFCTDCQNILQDNGLAFILEQIKELNDKLQQINTKLNSLINHCTG